MKNILLLIFGILVTFIGFRMYNYFDNNLKEFDKVPSKLYNKAVIVIITGALLTFASIVQFFK